MHRAATQNDALLLAMVTVWAVNFTAVKWGVATIPPLAFNALRFSLASATLLLARAWWNWQTRFRREDRWRLIGLGVMGNTLYQILFIHGIARTTAGNAAFILAFTPIIVAAGDWLLHRRRLDAKGSAGVVLSSAGLVAVVLVPAGVQLEQASALGDLMLLAATLLWGAYTLEVEPLFQRYPSHHVTMATMVAGTPGLILLGLPGLLAQDWSRVALRSIGALLFSGVFAIALAYLIWNRSVERVGGTRTAVYSNLTPVLAALIAWLALGESWTPVRIAGATAVVVGVLLTRRVGATPLPVQAPAGLPE